MCVMSSVISLAALPADVIIHCHSASLIAGNYFICVIPYFCPGKVLVMDYCCCIECHRWMTMEPNKQLFSFPHCPQELPNAVTVWSKYHLTPLNGKDCTLLSSPHQCIHITCPIFSLCVHRYQMSGLHKVRPSRWSGMPFCHVPDQA